MGPAAGARAEVVAITIATAVVTTGPIVTKRAYRDTRLEGWPSCTSPFSRPGSTRAEAPHHCAFVWVTTRHHPLFMEVRAYLTLHAHVRQDSEDDCLLGRCLEPPPSRQQECRQHGGDVALPPGRHPAVGRAHPRVGLDARCAGWLDRLSYRWRRLRDLPDGRRGPARAAPGSQDHPLFQILVQRHSRPCPCLRPGIVLLVVSLVAIGIGTVVTGWAGYVSNAVVELIRRLRRRGGQVSSCLL